MQAAVVVVVKVLLYNLNLFIKRPRLIGGALFYIKILSGCEI